MLPSPVAKPPNAPGVLPGGIYPSGYDPGNRGRGAMGAPGYCVKSTSILFEKSPKELGELPGALAIGAYSLSDDSKMLK